MSQRLRILFVDDEIAILDGLRRTLRSLRDHWEIRTAHGGEAALTLIRTEGELLDVIVTDMRMPTLDGVELLEAARQHAPHVVRIMLSGHSDQEAALRRSGPVHHYLSKPCDLDLLKATVERSCRVRRALQAAPLPTALESFASLSVVPGLYADILSCLRSGKSELEVIGRLLASDPLLCDRLMKLATACHGSPAHPHSLSQAIAALGSEALQILVFVHCLVKRSTRAEEGGLDPHDFLAHSDRIAWMAHRIAVEERQTPAQCRDALCAGLIHDCGTLTLAHYQPAAYRTITETVFADETSREAAETSVIGISHADAGAHLLSRWGLPDLLTESALFHHRPRDGLATTFAPVTAVHIAEVLDHHTSPNPSGAAHHFDQVHLSRIGLAHRIRHWNAMPATDAGWIVNRGSNP